MNKNKGITIFEVLIGIVIMISITSVVFYSLLNFRDEQALRNTEVEIVSMLNKARQNTLSSKNSTNYSVHFDSDKITLFSGSVYSDVNPSNESVMFNPPVTLAEVNGLNIGGGSDVIFDRLTGETLGGTITIELSSDNTKQKTITIMKTGIIN